MLRMSSPMSSNGRLAAIVEVGVGGARTRRWEYTWDNLDLIRIDRPGGTAWRFRAADLDHPGYMTQAILGGTRSFSWPPRCSKEKYLMIEEPKQLRWEKKPPKKCPEIIEGLIHETIEVYYSCYHGLKAKNMVKNNQIM